MNIQQIKQRFEIIGNSPLLDHAISTSMQVATTDLSVLITGESGTGKENIPKIIHQISHRKHSKYIAVNCGAIPEGTIDSELFGHEKGAFTGAHSTRSGYFEVADGGTIFLDEVAELPVQTQVRLLRVLETGEFIKVGSSKVQKTNVRIIAATNVNITNAIDKGKFREDLFYRLNTVPIQLPPLRERREDIHLLFRKFAADFAEKYRMPTVRLEEDAQNTLRNYRWPGNIRQLKNVTEQISVIEKERLINSDKLLNYLPNFQRTNLPTIYDNQTSGDSPSDRELLYKVLFDMRKEITDLKKLVVEGIKADGINLQSEENVQILNRIYSDVQSESEAPIQIRDNVGSVPKPIERPQIINPNDDTYNIHEEIEESLSIEEKEKELISKALSKYKGRRKQAANELGISERTLYRKIKEYDLK
ncbi:MAG: sigma-54-dependent Fis family transcriptional regulator [Crocinitomicaceae bacterium]|nr:sigma-54-dependent Fis family transcriptional regulator [Crocinitomicaceae bacterium]|tara:strand:- start:5276 stop:6532 length:1257 start_codon:yes stop_codon:yes gene_type:complete